MGVGRLVGIRRVAERGRQVVHRADHVARESEEAYRSDLRGRYDVVVHLWLAPTNTVLLTTDNPTGDPPVAWVSAYRRSRVVTIQLGHGPESQRDASFRRLMLNAITWTAAGP